MRAVKGSLDQLPLRNAWKIGQPSLDAHSWEHPSRSRQWMIAECCGTKKLKVNGNPDMAQVSTSYVGWQNLTMLMSMRRMTRLTNAFSKKIENQAHAIALHFMHYNFARIHQSLRVMPAMEAGIANHVWTLEEIVGLLGFD
jgi:hypothetical protein